MHYYYLFADVCENSCKVTKKSNIHKFYEINSIFANTELESFYFTMQKMSAH